MGVTAQVKMNLGLAVPGLQAHGRVELCDPSAPVAGDAVTASDLVAQLKGQRIFRTRQATKRAWRTTQSSHGGERFSTVRRQPTLNLACLWMRGTLCRLDDFEGTSVRTTCCLSTA